MISSVDNVDISNEIKPWGQNWFYLIILRSCLMTLSKFTLAWTCSINCNLCKNRSICRKLDTWYHCCQYYGTILTYNVHVIYRVYCPHNMTFTGCQTMQRLLGQQKIMTKSWNNFETQMTKLVCFNEGLAMTCDHRQAPPSR